MTGRANIEYAVWTAFAVPTLKLVQPHLKIGAMIVADNVVKSQEGYKDVMAYLDDPVNGFKRTTAPYGGGLEIAVYVGHEGT